MALDPAPDTRSHILEAAERIIQDRGLGAATTRAIAKAARCAEGSIYRYFPDKHALFMEIVRNRGPAFIELVHSLPDRAGKGTVAGNLRDTALSALAFYRVIMPVVGGSLGNHELLTEQRRHWRREETGPMHALEAVTAYLLSEQRLGRISRKASVEHATKLLLGSCFAQACLEELVGEAAAPDSDERYASEIVHSLMEGLGTGKGRSK